MVNFWNLDYYMLRCRHLVFRAIACLCVLLICMSNSFPTLWRFSAITATNSLFVAFLLSPAFSLMPITFILFVSASSCSCWIISWSFVILKIFFPNYNAVFKISMSVFVFIHGVLTALNSIFWFHENLFESFSHILIICCTVLSMFPSLSFAPLLFN